MSTEQKPLALRLADKFDHPLPPEWEEMKQAATELRRLAAVEAERDALLRAVADHVTVRGEYLAQITALRAQVEALTKPSAQPEVHAPKCPALNGGKCICTRSDRHDPGVDGAWARFCATVGDGPDAPYPGMISSFERYYSQSFADKDWREEASVWAAAWKAAMLYAPQPLTRPAVPGEHYDEVRATLTGLHALCKNISDMERRVGPLGSHARGYTHKITAALRHLDLLAAAPQPEQVAGPAVPAPDLVERCKEILAWKDTGILPANALRSYADSKWVELGSHSFRLQRAENETARQAMEWAAAPQPD